MSTDRIAEWIAHWAAERDAAETRAYTAEKEIEALQARCPHIHCAAFNGVLVCAICGLGGEL